MGRRGGHDNNKTERRDGWHIVAIRVQVGHFFVVVVVLFEGEKQTEGNGHQDQTPPEEDEKEWAVIVLWLTLTLDVLLFLCWALPRGALSRGLSPTSFM